MPPGRVIGIDAGGTKLLGGVVDAGLVVHHRVHRHIQGLDQAQLVETIVDAVDEARSAAPDADRVGFGIAALVRPETGWVMVSNHLPLDGVPFQALMSERLDLPVSVDNDSNVAMLAEHRGGAARGARDAVMLTLGTGIGGGLLFGGKVYRGSAGAGAELGHIVVDPDGPECPGNCPGRGCLEAFASGNAIGRAGDWGAVSSPARRRGAASRASHGACCRRCGRQTLSRARPPAARARCWTATASTPSLSRTTSTTRTSARRSSWSGCARARRLLSCRTRACRSCPTRATCSCARAWRRGCRWRYCRDRRRRSRRSWPPPRRPTAGASPASCRARRATSAARSPSRAELSW